MPSGLTAALGGEPLDPLSARLMQAVRVLSLLLLLVVANFFLNSGEQSLNPIAVAAQRTQDKPGARFTMKALYTSPSLPRPASASGRGAYNSQTGLSEATLEMSTPAGELSFEVVGDETTMYMRGSEISSELPDGKEWLKLQPLLGHSESEAMVGGGDANSSLQMLASSGGEVERLGAEQVRGTPTQRYRAVIELGTYAAALRAEGKEEIAEIYDHYADEMTAAPTVEAWVDAKDVVRRMRMVMEIPPPQPGAPTVTMDMRMELFDFGARPQIQLPDDSRVFDATPLLEQQLG